MFLEKTVSSLTVAVLAAGKEKKKKTFLLCCNKTEARGNRGQYNSVNHCMKYAFAVL